MLEINRLSNGEGHFLFGFHDLPAWNYNGDRHVCLNIDDVTLPPDPNKYYGVGFLDNQGNYTQVTTTQTFNYPQGARQQWLANSNHIIVNDRVDNSCIAKIIDTDSATEIKKLKYSAHTVDQKGFAYSLDYARLYRLGGYGYAGLHDPFALDHYPKMSGIIKHNIYSEESKILVSVYDVANFNMEPNKGKHHYITHSVLNPSQNRLAFLHRYKLSDGGETTRLMTIGTNGSGLRCLASGFLSHFDWMDDESILIYGRTGSATEALRGSIIYRIIPALFLKQGKKILKQLLFQKKPAGSQSFAWLKIADCDKSSMIKVAQGIIMEDGHPMFCPTNRKWMICDNYPDLNGKRTLFLYNVNTNQKIDIGQFKMINEKPDLQKSMNLLMDVDPKIIRTIGIENLAFTRSGLHCDLHPRWSMDGTKVSFDSIHEGSRQIYKVETGKLN